jgi:hypothetical protein
MVCLGRLRNWTGRWLFDFVGFAQRAEGAEGASMERWEEIKPRLVHVQSAPPLHRVNGIGCALLGRKREIPGSALYFKGYWLTIFFFPILPLCFYVVSGGYPKYRFHAKMSIWNFVKTYRWSSITYLFSAFFDSILFFVFFFGLMFGVYYVVHIIFAPFR